jgi:endonuclease/exonuclease/phosphatase family metal-dependent hydrolase
MVVVGVIVVIGLSMRLHPGPSWRGVSPELRVLNFNIQQGFSRSGSVNYYSIYNMLDAERPHITTLQETDTMHIVHGNLDLIDFWATKLKLYSWYAPATKADTWGCAILSTQRLFHGQSRVLPSPHGENACFQQAEFDFRGKRVQVMNTHFGVLDSDIQLQAAAIASAVNLTKPLLLSGDFNMAPLSQAYNTTVASGVLDSRVAQIGPWKGPGDRDPGAGLLFSSPALKCLSWKEPHYDQAMTSDGYPIVSAFDFV